MDDRLTPLEAEVLEMTDRKAVCKPTDSYGTAPRPKQKKDHMGLWIGIGLVVIGLCTFGVIAAMFDVRIDRDGDGRLRLSMRSSEQPQNQNPVKDLNILPEGEEAPFRTGSQNEGAEDLMLSSSKNGRELSASEVYAAVNASVVCIELDTYYGTQYYTGVVISSDGYILSASGGMSGYVSISASFSDGSVLPLSKIGEDTVTGVCLLKAETEGLTQAVFEADPDLTVGESVYCVGNPYGTTLSNVFYAGMLSGTADKTINGVSYTLLQSSMDLQTAGYGCPIFNSGGHVIGLTSAVGSRLISGGADPCFGVSAADLQRIVSGFSSTQESGLWLGFEVEPIPLEYQYLFDYPEGVWIREVARGTRVDGVLEPFDIILSVNGTEIRSTEDFYAALQNGASEGYAAVILYRNGKQYFAKVPLLQR